MGASMPYPLQTEEGPDAPARALWDSILQGFRDDRLGFTRVAAPGVFGVPFGIGVEVAPTVLERFEKIVGEADSLAIERCIGIITSRDFTEALKKLGAKKDNIKLLIVHGDSDQSESSLLWNHIY
jgi:hypothetical protein